MAIGNGAYDQMQLDIYGELMDSVYLYNKYGQPISYDLWRHLRRLINWVCDHWQQKDEGIWEVRGGQQHFVYSKLMCWVAVDRALRLADKRSFPADRERWSDVRDRIYEEIMAKGWHQQRNAFVQHYDSEALDAANLTMPLVFFVSPTDPRMLRTLEHSKAGGKVAGKSIISVSPGHHKEWDSWHLKNGPLELVLVPHVGGRIMGMIWREHDLSFTQPTLEGHVEDLSAIDDVNARKRELGFLL